MSAADRLKQRILDDEDRETDPGRRVSCRVYGIRRQEYHWTRPDLGKSWRPWGDAVRRHFCNDRCETYTVWAYELRLDGRLVSSDNGRGWERIYKTALREAVLLRHLMGDVTALRHQTVSVGGGELV